MCVTRASHCCGLSRCRAQVPDTQAQRPWLTGLATPRHMGSSQTRARTCIGRRTLNHCATREAQENTFNLTVQYLENYSSTSYIIAAFMLTSRHPGLEIKMLGFPGGAVVESPPANAGNTGSCPGPGRSHMPRSGWAREPWLLSLRVQSLCSAKGEATTVRGPRTAKKKEKLR